MREGITGVLCEGQKSPISRDGIRNGPRAGIQGGFVIRYYFLFDSSEMKAVMAGKRDKEVNVVEHIHGYTASRFTFTFSQSFNFRIGKIFK